MLPTKLAVLSAQSWTEVRRFPEIFNSLGTNDGAIGSKFNFLIKFAGMSGGH